MIDRRMKLFPYTGVELCKFGCGRIAIFISSKGKLLCTDSVFKCPSIQEKRKQTWITNYGTDNPMKNKDVNAKTRSTMKERYGNEVFSKTDLWLEKTIATNMERFGAEFNFLTDEFRDKTAEICMQKYGFDNASKSQEVIDKILDTKMKRYGTVTVGSCNSSKKEVEWLENLPNYSDIIMQKTLTMEDGKNYKVDGYDPKTNTVYEFFGDFWHGNPSIYDYNEINKVTGDTFGTLLEKTKLKINNLKNNGYNTIAIWEDGSEFKEV